MYTQVGFADFLGRSFAWAKAEHGIDFGEYPNVAMNWKESDWLYEMLPGFGVRIFRWPPYKGREAKIDGPNWDDTRQTRETFEPRFEADFRSAVERLFP